MPRFARVDILGVNCSVRSVQRCEAGADHGVRHKPDTGLPDFQIEFPLDTTRTLTKLLAAGTLRRYPGVRLQLSHAGGAFPFLSYRIIGALEKGLAPGSHGGNASGGVGFATASKGLYYDTALNAVPHAMESVLTVSDLDHVVFGSDFPFTELLYLTKGDPAPELSHIFSDAERAKVERANALR